MTYSQYFDLRERLKKDLEKLYKQYHVMEECYIKTQMNSVRIEMEHLLAVIQPIEEAVNNLDYFVEYD